MKDLKTYLPTLINIALIVGLLYIAWKGKGYLDSFLSTDDDVDREDALADPNAANLSYPIINYTNWANRIEVALENLYNDDEDAVYSVFEKMLNNDDVLQLQKSFGTRARSPWGIGIIGGYTGTLSEWLTAQLSENEREHINQLLASNGVTIQF